MQRQATTQAAAPGPRLLTTRQAADELGVSPRHVADLIAEGSLLAVRVGRRALRIDRADLEAFIRDRKA